MESSSKLNSYSMQELAPIICEFLDQGKNVIIAAKGNSMRPLLRNRKDKVVLSPCRGDKCCVGDAALYQRTGGQYVLHRIVSQAKDGSFVFMGDGQTVPERGVAPQQIIAKATAFYRGKKYVSAKSSGYRVYKKLWIGSMALRKTCLRVLNVTQRIKQIIKDKTDRR